MDKEKFVKYKTWSTDELVTALMIAESNAGVEKERSDFYKAQMESMRSERDALFKKAAGIDLPMPRQERRVQQERRSDGEFDFPLPALDGVKPPLIPGKK